jgi:hypothetical protein
VAVVGVAIVLAYTIARAFVLDGFHDPDERAAASAVWAAFLGDLRTFGWVLVVSGRRGRRRGGLPRAPGGGRGGAAARVAVGDHGARDDMAAGGAGRRARRRRHLIVTQPLTAVQVAATLVGVYIAYEGIEAILRLIYVAPDPAATELAAERRSGLLHRARRLAVPAIAALVVAGVVAAFLGGGGASAPAASISAMRGPRGAVRPAAGRGRAAGHAQLDVGAAEGLVLLRAGSLHRRAAPGRHPRPAARHPLRRQPRPRRVRTYFPNKRSLDLVKDQDGVSDETSRPR